MFPIHTPEDSFAIKTEGGIRVSNGVHGLPRTPIKVEDYDSRPTRGYATFVGSMVFDVRAKLTGAPDLYSEALT
jgi:hypothetical protein